MYNAPNEGLTEEQAKIREKYLAVLNDLIRIQYPNKDKRTPAKFKKISMPLMSRFYPQL